MGQLIRKDKEYTKESFSGSKNLVLQASKQGIEQLNIQDIFMPDSRAVKQAK